MKTGLCKSLLVVAVSATIAAPVANATNGYFMYGYSTKDKGLAGAGAALSQDAMASATNPAGMASVGDRLDVGLQIFSPSPRSYTVSGTPSGAPGTFPLASEKVESDGDYFLIPHFAYNMGLDSSSAVGVSVYGNGGMNTEYKPTATNPSGTFGAGTAGVNLEQLFFNFSYAYKLQDKHAIGVSLILVAQRFRAMGLESFGGFSLDASNLSGNRNSYSYGGGIKLGYQGEVSKGLRVGVSYQSKMSMGEFDEYKGLFAESGDFDIPSTYTLGVSYEIDGVGTIVADYQRIMYSDVASISNPIANLQTGCTPGAPATGAGCLGGSNGGGFGWEDIGVIKVGYQWKAADMDWRVGYSHSDQPIQNSEVLFNILAPATIQDHVTFGLTKDMGSNQEFNFSAGYALKNSVEGPNAFDAPNTQTIKLEMSQIDLQAGWAWKF
jgi:long-chain fatty acid transport protein